LAASSVTETYCRSCACQCQ